MDHGYELLLVRQKTLILLALNIAKWMLWAVIASEEVVNQSKVKEATEITHPLLQVKTLIGNKCVGGA